MKHIFSSFALLMTLPLGALELPPEGVLNPRIPIVAPAKGGAVGCFMPLANIDFIYSVSPHLKEMRSGNADFFVRDIPQRKMRRIFVLSEKKSGRRLALTIPDSASGNRRFCLEGTETKTSSLILPVGKWRKINLQWGNGRAYLSGGRTGSFNSRRFCAGYNSRAFAVSG
mgnify:CR=1 FL=1